MVYVLSQDGKPLMPTERHGKVRHMLRDGQAKAVKAKPFTIQLTYETTTYTQPITLGVDAGYQNVGLSAVSKKKELFSAECELLKGQAERNKERVMYRRQRRSRLRHRKPRFNNRRKPDGWLAPSMQHKLDSHIRLINKAKSILPITETIIEVANFDIQKIKNPDIQGVEYQQGEQFGHYNIREYIFFRDDYTCQFCGRKNLPLEMHHIGYWKKDKTDRPSNLATACVKCHKPENHKKGEILWGWQPKLKPFKAETFMTTVRWKIVDALNCKHTYGYITKNNRIALKLPKSHTNDAFCIAGGITQKRAETLIITQTRRNNRSLEKFYDAKYIDTRTGKNVSGQELNNGRRTRNKNLNTENLHKHRGQKTAKGRRNIRRQRYFYQPNDLVIYKGKKYQVAGVQNRGTYIRLKCLKKVPRIDLVQPYRFIKGLSIA